VGSEFFVTCTPRLRYSASHSSVVNSMMPSPVAKMPPDDVPQIISNASDTGLPSVFSSARTCVDRASE
jgi:hypothetical protein